MRLTRFRPASNIRLKMTVGAGTLPFPLALIAQRCRRGERVEADLKRGFRDHVMVDGRCLGRRLTAHSFAQEIGRSPEGVADSEFYR